MSAKLKNKWLLVCLVLVFLSAGCGNRVTFEKIDRKGHVRIDLGGEGYCFHVPTDWEIRERLEESDVACMAPLTDGFRESIVVRSLPAKEISDPEQILRSQLELMGAKVDVLEPWSEVDKPVVVVLESRFAEEPLGQLLFVHKRENGDGVVFICTTTKAKLDERRGFFSDIIKKAKYDIEDCPGPGGLPKVFPTPEVTMSPAP